MVSLYELLAQVADEPRPESWRVVADFLVERSDVRGPLLLTELDGVLTDEARRTHLPELLGPFADDVSGARGEPDPDASLGGRGPRGRRGRGLASLIDPPRDRRQPRPPPHLDHTDWFGGFLVSATLRRTHPSSPALDTLVGRLLEQPAAAGLERLSLGSPRRIDHPVDWIASLERLIEEGPHPMLRELRIGRPRNRWGRKGPVGSLVGLAGAAPRLTSLELQDLWFTDFDFELLPRLEHLGAEALSLEDVVGLLEHPMPQLQALRLDGSGFDADIDGLGLTPERLPALRELSLRNYSADANLFTSLAAHPLLPRLRVLRLEACELGDAEAAELDPEAFAHLEELDLSGNMLSEDAVDDILAVLPDAELGDQEWVEEYDGIME